MKAIVQDEYGIGDVLEFKDVDKPEIADNEVPKALSYLTEGHARGKVAISV